jgi:hypothetical protein
VVVGSVVVVVVVDVEVVVGGSVVVVVAGVVVVTLTARGGSEIFPATVRRFDEIQSCAEGTPLWLVSMSVNVLIGALGINQPDAPTESSVPPVSHPEDASHVGVSKGAVTPEQVLGLVVAMSQKLKTD